MHYDKTAFIESLPGGDKKIVNYGEFVSTLLKKYPKGRRDPMNLMHIALGLVGEAAEVADIIKKYVVYEQPLTKEMIDALNKEIGDMNFFLTAIQEAFLISDLEIISMNVSKLMARYPKGEYSNADAQARVDKAEEDKSEAELIMENKNG